MEFLAAAGCQVKWNESIGGRQFDITIRSQAGVHQLLTVVECKSSKRKVSVGHVDALATKAKDAFANKAIIVSDVGFQEGCIDVAKRNGIDLLILKLEHRTGGIEQHPHFQYFDSVTQEALTSYAILTNVTGDPIFVFPAAGLPLGFDSEMKEERFYTIPMLGSYWYCATVEQDYFRVVCLEEPVRTFVFEAYHDDEESVCQANASPQRRLLNRRFRRSCSISS